MLLPEPISALVAALSRLPGIGPRSAERLALHLAQTDSPAVRQLAEALLNAREKIRACSLCGALTERDPCVLCADERRDAGSICVVERPVDVFSSRKPGFSTGNIMSSAEEFPPSTEWSRKICASPPWKRAWAAGSRKSFSP